MKLVALEIRNYRTLQSLDLRFGGQYTAICGANDSGKTNVIRAIQTIVRHDAPYFILDGGAVELKNDLPKWLDPAEERVISIKLRLSVSKTRDTGLYEFLVRQLSLGGESDAIDFKLKTSYREDRADPQVTVSLRDKVFVALEAQEVLKKLQTSQSILFHTSTQLDELRYGEGLTQFEEIAGFNKEIVNIKNQVERKLKRVAKDKQQEIERLLGRLEKNYNVGLTLSSVNLQNIPVNISLGEKRYPVPLDSWGSGTQNRAAILMTLFRARQISDAEASAEKITPIIVIEEPESFLHPAAQADFGRVLQELAREFDVQVIVTTHSPYLLSLRDPSSNFLLRRRQYRGNARDTELVETDGEDWAHPFGQALGLNADEFRPWKGLFASPQDHVLLVEGVTDKEYFELLRDEAHGSNRLKFGGEIVAYEGCDNLCNNVLLRFIKNKYRKLFITFDLDVNEKVEKALKSVGLEKGRDYLPLGIDAPGKRNIEGWLPESVVGAVHLKNTGLAVAATNGTNDERKRARNQLKKLYLDEFRRACRPGVGHFGEFYKATRIINSALA